MNPGAAEPAVVAPALAAPDRWVVALAVAVATVLRFWTTSPLWLDEALSVNIASLGPSQLLDALRLEAHPPLYYLALHGWMDLFGDGDVAVRAFSGVCSVLALPLAWEAGRRRAGRAGGAAVLLLTAVAPFSLRYATEARMYALLSLLVLGAWLLADTLRSRPSRWRWVLLALLTGGSILTHYWALYLGAAAVAALGWRWWRHGERDVALRIGSALAAGGLLLLPWLPTFVHQLTETGTPWATATRPTSAVVELAGGLGGGGAFAEGLLFGVTVLGLAVLGLLLASVRGHELVLNLRTSPPVRPEMAVAGLTVAVGLAVGTVTDATFIARYGAAFLPLVFVAAGVGLARLPPVVARRVATAVVLVLASVGAVLNVVDDRTQGARIASAIEADASPGDLVAFCPDQLGPSTLRALDPALDAVGIPALERPERIHWANYAERNRAADAGDVAARLLRRAPTSTIWLVYGTTYRTYEGLCEGIVAALGAARPATTIVQSADPDVFEPATLQRFDP